MKNIRHLVLGGLMVGAGLLAACGVSSTPAPQRTVSANPTAAPAATTAPAAEATTNVSDLATSVAIVQNPPTAAPEGKVTPSASVSLNRAFRIGSVNGTLVSYQLVPGDGNTCPTITPRNLVLNVQLENTAVKDYWLTADMLKILGPDDKASTTIYNGSVGTGRGGSETTLMIPASSKIETTFCTGLTVDDDPAKFSLVLGNSEFRQVRVPFAADAAVQGSAYVQSALDKKFTYKGAEFTLPAVIVTSGVWSDQSGAGQAHNDSVWLLLPTQVNNQNNPNLFVEKGEVNLDADGKKLAPSYDFVKMYQPAPYGLAQGKTGQGALLFEIPQTASKVVLHFKSGDSKFPGDVTIPIDIPVIQ